MKTISELLAHNVRAVMEAREIHTQMELSKVTKVPQKTISNVLTPAHRPSTKTGRTPSLTLANLEKLAAGLKVPAWALIRPQAAQNEEFFALPLLRRPKK